MQEVEKFRKKVLGAFSDRVHSIILHGSMARGAMKDSDIDILIVGEERKD